MSLKINDLTWEQFRDRVPSLCDLAMMPVGTIEAHGAIPLGTDTIIPEALALALAPRLGALIAPCASIVPTGIIARSHAAGTRSRNCSQVRSLIFKLIVSSSKR